MLFELYSNLCPRAIEKGGNKVFAMKMEGIRSHGCERELQGCIHAVPGIFMANTLCQCNLRPHPVKIT
jgi:hypothetical protein